MRETWDDRSTARRRRPSPAPWVVLVCVVALLPRTALAVTKWKGLQPGRSTRADVERVLGAPARSITDRLVVYSPQEGGGRIVVEYRAGTGVVNRIEIDLLDPLSRSALVETFALSRIPSTKQPAPGDKLAEYFAGDASMVFFYSTKDEASTVARLGFYSRELFDQITGQSTTDPNPAPAPPTGPTVPPPSTPPPPAPQPPAPLPAPPVTTAPTQKFDPSQCQDIYYWARSEQDVARRSGIVARRQMAMDITIAAQRGDCPTARAKADQYKQTYR